MKQKLKKYLQFGVLLFVFSMTFTNCDREPLETYQGTNNSKIKISEINLANFKNKNKVFEKIEQFTGNKKHQGLQNREVYDSINDFYIDTNNAILIEYETYHWLTFSITRNTEVAGIENLVLKYQVESDTYTSQLVHYNFSEDDLTKLENSQYVSIADKATFYPLDNYAESDLFDALSRTFMKTL